MEPEGGSLLELPMEEADILSEVELSKSHIRTQDECSEHVEILIEENQHTSIPCITSTSMDFEFTNADLVNSTEFSMDNSAMFGISESDIEVERNGCDDLFQDSSCFNSEAGKSDEVLISSGLTVLTNNNISCASKDIGLQLQIIPLDKLQYVSTVQTNKGLHILAVPADITVNHIQQQYLRTITDSLKHSFCNTLQDTAPVTSGQIVSLSTSQSNCHSKNTTMSHKRELTSWKGTENKISPDNTVANVKTMQTMTESFHSHFSQRKQMVSLLKNSSYGKNTGNSVCKKPAGSVTLTIPLTVNRQQSTCKTSQSMKKLDSKVTDVTHYSVKTTDGNIKSPEHSKPLREPVAVKADCLPSSTVQSKDKHPSIQTSNNRITNSSNGCNKRNIQKYSCTECTAKFSKEGHFKNHLIVHKQIASLKDSSSDTGSLDNENTGSGSISNMSNPNESVSGEPRKGKQEVGEFNNIVSGATKTELEHSLLRCEVCDMLFKTRGNLTRHQLTHTSKSKVGLLCLLVVALVTVSCSIDILLALSKAHSIKGIKTITQYFQNKMYILAN